MASAGYVGEHYGGYGGLGYGGLGGLGGYYGGPLGYGGYGHATPVAYAAPVVKTIAPVATSYQNSYQVSARVLTLTRVRLVAESHGLCVIPFASFIQISKAAIPVHYAAPAVIKAPVVAAAPVAYAAAPAYGLGHELGYGGVGYGHGYSHGYGLGHGLGYGSHYGHY